jgi:hypothetical protein
MSRSTFRHLETEGFLRRAASDVFVVGAAPLTWEQQLMVGTLQLGEGAFVSGRAAAGLHRFDTFPAGPIEFVVPPERRRRTAPGVVRSTFAPFAPDDTTFIRGIPCTSPTRTVFELASIVKVKRLEHAIDSALRDRLTSEGALIDVLQRLRVSGRHGVKCLEEALGITGGPMAHSVLERRFLRLVKEFDLPVPRSQVTFVDQDQRFVARVDFLFGDIVVVEVEGYRFHATRAQRQRDNQRRNGLVRQGRHVLVFTYDDVRDRNDDVAREVLGALRILGQSNKAA